MSLSTTIDIARSSLSVTSDRSALVSRNVGHANDASASRKIAHLVTDFGGSPRLGSISRTTTEALQTSVNEARSDSARANVIVAALDRLDAGVGDPADEGGPAAMMAMLQASLQLYASRPSDVGQATAVVNAAHGVAGTLRSSAKLVDDVRQQANDDIGETVARLNADLARLEHLNDKIVIGTKVGADVTDDLDARDQLVAAIADDVGITVISRSDNAVSLYTDSGIVLFDGKARPVALQATTMVAGQPGAAITFDSVPATGPGAVMAITSGRLAGLIEVRDRLALTSSAQLDEMTRALVSAFAESDQQTLPSLPDLAGLFTTDAAGTVHAGAAWVPGLARTIAVNPNADAAQGGNPLLLRDGGISAPSNQAYTYNIDGRTAFAGRIEQLLDGLGASRAFDARSQLGQSASALEFGAAAAGWLAGQRQTHAKDATFASALLVRSQEALTRVSGINIDDEMTQLLELERTYQASAKLLSVVDAMYAALMQSVG